MELRGLFLLVKFLSLLCCNQTKVIHSYLSSPFSLPSLHILGNVGSSFQMEFFTLPGLSEDLASSVFASLDHIPDYRLRPIIHILGHVLNILSIGCRCCAKRSGFFLMNITVLCEESGAVLSSGVLWQCALPPAGPSLHLHAAGQDLCTGNAWNLNHEFAFCFILFFLIFCSLIFAETQCQMAGNQPEDISKVSTKSFLCFSRRKDTAWQILPIEIWGEAYWTTVTLERKLPSCNYWVLWM